MIFNDEKLFERIVDAVEDTIPKDTELENLEIKDLAHGEVRKVHVELRTENGNRMDLSGQIGDIQR